MDECNPEHKPDGCGCIAHYAEVFAPATRKSTSTDMGYYGQPAIELTDDQSRRLFLFERWPERFRLDYRRNRAKATIARIDHFIATKGAE